MTATDPTRGRKCEWIGEQAALKEFAMFTGGTQGQQHIKPLHWYVASRLVLEGGFRPEEITPRPPFESFERDGRPWLRYDKEKANGVESTILGGLKTKDVDVVVAKPGIGPVFAVSCKGMTKAFRNLTNRMEETIGECTNLHITYPAMVFGYLFVIRANRLPGSAISAIEAEGDTPLPQLNLNDIAIDENGATVESIIRFQTVLEELTGRRGIRNDISRYEAIGLALIEIEKGKAGTISQSFPKEESPLRFERFFEQLYRRYDERFVYSAPSLKALTGRKLWTLDEAILNDPRCAENNYVIRSES